MPHIDLNCDLGEGGVHDAAMMQLISSANIACGAHAGDDKTMRETVVLTQAHGVAIGAHPGFADRANFGRREVAMSGAELRELVRTQVLRLREFAPVRHVKPHGALYHLAARDAQVAATIVAAVREIDHSLLLYAPANSKLAEAAVADGLRVCPEVFADRRYERDGSLTPRSRPDALIHDERESAAQVLRMIREGVVRSTDGIDVPITAGTICVHGDGPNPVTVAQRLRAELTAAGIEIHAPIG